MVAEYQVIWGDYLVDFEKEINQAIAEGWQPIGGVSLTRWERRYGNGDTEPAYEFAQAMVKREEEK